MISCVMSGAFLSIYSGTLLVYTCEMVLCYGSGVSIIKQLWTWGGKVQNTALIGAGHPINNKKLMDM